MVTAIIHASDSLSRAHESDQAYLLERLLSLGMLDATGSGFCISKFVNHAFTCDLDFSMRPEMLELLSKLGSSLDLFAEDPAAINPKYHPILRLLSHVQTPSDILHEDPWCNFKKEMALFLVILQEMNKQPVFEVPSFLSSYLAHLEISYRKISDEGILERLLPVLLKSNFSCEAQLDILICALNNILIDITISQTSNDFKKACDLIQTVFTQNQTQALMPMTPGLVRPGMRALGGIGTSAKKDCVTVQDLGFIHPSRSAFERVQEFFILERISAFPLCSRLIIPSIHPDLIDHRYNTLHAAAIEALPFLMSHKKITWLTGTNHLTLVAMNVAKMKIGDHELKLIPTGELLSKNIAPLAGELEMGIAERGVNLIALSGVTPKAASSAKSYAFMPTARLYSSEAPLMQAIDLLFPSSSATVSFSNELKKLLLIKVFSLLDRNQHPYQSELSFLHQLKIGVLRILDYGLFSEAEIKIIHEHLKMFSAPIIDDIVTSQTIVKDHILPLFEKAPLELDVKIQVLLQKRPIPIIFAACTRPYDPHFIRVDSDIAGEVGYRGSLTLGKQIKVIFCPRDDADMALIRAAVAPLDVSVMSFEAMDIIVKYQ